MDLVSLFRLLGRWWWVSLPVFLVGAGGLVASIVLVPPAYVATSSVVLLSPPAPPEIEETQTAAADDQNPYVQFGDLSIVVDILRRIMISPATADRLEVEGVAGDYVVAANIDFERGPIIDVSTEGDTRAEALESNGVVVGELEDQLARLQDQQGTNPDFWITVDRVVQPDRAEREYASTVRRTVAAAAVLVLVVIAAVAVAESIGRRGARRRRTSPAVLPGTAA